MLWDSFLITTLFDHVYINNFWHNFISFKKDKIPPIFFILFALKKHCLMRAQSLHSVRKYLTVLCV